MSTENILPGASGGPARKGPPRLSPALTRLAKRALDVDVDEIRTYEPTELDIQVAEAMVGGARTFQEIAATLGVHPSYVSRALKDPVRCGWLSEQLRRIVSKRIGLVDAALLSKALAGNVQAMKLYYERFGELSARANVHLNLHGSLDFDPRQLNDQDLDMLIHNEAQKHATDATFEVAQEGPQKAPESTQKSGGVGTPTEPSGEST